MSLASDEPAQEVPLIVPLLFLGWGVFLAVRHRYAFKDPDRLLREIAESRARISGNGDPEQEYQQQRRLRWLLPVITFGFFATVVWMLVVAVKQL